MIDPTTIVQPTALGINAPTTLEGGGSIRDLAAAAVAQTLTFPADLRSATGAYPFCMITITEYPVLDKTLIKDLQNQTSIVGAAGAVTTALGNSIVNTAGVSQNGVSQPTKGTVVGTVVLPIPNNVTNSVSIDWSMEDFAGGRAALNAAAQIDDDIGSLLRGGRSLKDYGATAKNIAQNSGAAITSATTAALSNLLQKTANIIANPKKQAFFSGVQPRQWIGEWIFTANNQAEATTIEAIIKTLTKYSLPAITTGALLFLFPMEFNIVFSGVLGFPKFDSMVCVGISTNYTPTTLQLLADGHAVQIVMSMAFLETTIRTQGRPGLM